MRFAAGLAASPRNEQMSDDETTMTNETKDGSVQMETAHTQVPVAKVDCHGFGE